MIDKVYSSFDQAVEDIFDGATVLVGGFGPIGGNPSYLIRALADRMAKDLTLVGNSMGMGRELRKRYHELGFLKLVPDFDDLGLIITNGQVKKGIGSFIFAPNPNDMTPFRERLAEGEVEAEVVPQGTLAKRIEAARDGIPAFYSPVGPGTVLSNGKEIREFNGREYQLEYAIEADFALIRAYKADKRGNLIYRGTSRTFNAVMAGAAKVTVAEVDQIVEVGALDPEAVVTPGIYVDRVVERPGGGGE